LTADKQVGAFNLMIDWIGAAKIEENELEK